MKKTIVKFYFRSEKPTKGNEYEFLMEHYCLEKFDQEHKLDKDNEQKPMFKTKDKVAKMQILPNLFSFVQGNKYYTCYYRKTIIENYGFVKTLGITGTQDKNELEELTFDTTLYDFIQPTH